MDTTDVARRVEAFFTYLDETVFTGDMAANMALRVEVVEACTVGDGMVVAVIAPWTIAFVLFFEDPFPESLTVGGRRLPVLINDVPDLGRYRSVTPIGGVESVGSQDLAREMVSAAIGPLCDAIVKERDVGSVESPSRRIFFRSLSGGDGSSS